MRNLKIVGLFCLSLLVFAACSDDDTPDPVNEEEVITTMTVTLTPVGGGTAITLRSQDLDGDGPNAPVDPKLNWTPDLIRPMRAFLGRFHDLGQHALHVLGMDEENGSAVCADAGRAEDAFAHGFELGARDFDVGHLEADMMLPTRRVLGKKAIDRRAFVKRLDQLNLRAVHTGVRRRIDKANLHALLRQVERLSDMRRTHDVAVMRDGVRNGRRCNADMVETA